MTRKYEFTGEERNGLRRIRRLSDGMIGGWIEDERNLSHERSAWVFGNARVSGDALVFGDAQVSGDARVCGNAWVTSSPRMATRSDNYTFTLFPCADGVWRMTAGCRYFTMPEAWAHWGHGERAGTDLGAESEDILIMFEHHIERVGKKA